MQQISLNTTSFRHTDSIDIRRPRLPRARERGISRASTRRELREAHPTRHIANPGKQVHPRFVFRTILVAASSVWWLY